VYDPEKPVWHQDIEELEEPAYVQEARDAYLEAVQRATDATIEKIRARRASGREQ
jgi:hypothetical protein